MEQESISLAENECRVNLANLYNLTRGDDEYQLLSHGTSAVQEQRLNLLIHHLQNNPLILGHAIMDVALEDQVEEANFFSLTGQVTLLAFFPQDRQVYFICFPSQGYCAVPWIGRSGACPETDWSRTLVLTLPIQLKAQKTTKLLYIYCLISWSSGSWIRPQHPKDGSSFLYSHRNCETWECLEQWFGCRQHLLRGRWCLWHSSTQRLPNSTA